MLGGQGVGAQGAPLVKGRSPVFHPAKCQDHHTFRDRDRFLGATTPPHSAMVAVVAMVAAMVAVVHVVDGQAKIHIQRRCYVCRSRGELGDCRDQFIPPEPLPPGTPVQVLGPFSLLVLCFLVWVSAVLEDIWLT